MASVTATDWINVMNLDITETQGEYILDTAIDLLNIYDVQLSNMSGTAGSKTVTLTSKERGGVFLIARIIYHSFFKDIDSSSGPGYSESRRDIMGDPVIMATAEKIANRLQADDYERIPFIVATDESGIS